MFGCRKTDDRMNAEQAKQLLERVAALERNYAQDVLKLNRENRDLRKRVESSEKRYKELKDRFDGIQIAGAGVDTGNASPKTGNVDEELRKYVADLKKRIEEGRLVDKTMLERVRAVAKQTACIDAMQERLTMLTSWKEKKETDDQQKSKRIKQLEHLNVQTRDSIFCADLGTKKPLEQLEVVKVNECASVLSSSTGPFNSKSGILKPNHDGIYNLGWKIHQKGDGKIRFIMAIDGMPGRIYLGSTFEAGGICSGTLVVPLKKEQRVWIEAKRVAGPDAQVYGCNFMGWLLEINSLGTLETIGNLQQSLFSSIVNDCQHL